MKKLITTIMLLCLLPAGAAGAATYYVTQSGTGTGTVASPGSIAEYNAGAAPYDSLAAGDVIYLGGRQTTSVVPPVGGASEGARVTLRGDYPDNPYTFDGSVLVETWTDDSDGTYSKAGITSCYFFMEDGIPLTYTADDTVEAGEWYLDGGDVLHYAPTAGVPTAHVTRRSIRTRAVRLSNLSYMTVKNMTLTHAIYGTEVIETTAASNYMIYENLTITKCRLGIYQEADGGHNHTNGVITGCTFTNLALAVLFNSDDVAAEEFVSWEISSNDFVNTGYVDGNSGTWWTSALAAASDQECIGTQNLNDSSINLNTFTGGAAFGVFLYAESTAGCSGNEITNNVFNGVGFRAFRIAPSPADANVTDCGGNLVHNNLFLDCGGLDPNIDAVVQLSNVFAGPSASYNEFDNNTIVATTGTIIGVYMDNNSDYYKGRNNIIDGMAVHIQTSDAVPNIDWDYNQYDDDTGTKFDWAGTDYNYADWKTNSSQDGNSPDIADPNFINITACLAGNIRGCTPKNPDMYGGTSGGNIPKEDWFGINDGIIGAIKDTRKLTILED